jgi:hypothetical protein
VRTVEQVVQECLQSLVAENVCACSALLRVIRVDYRDDVQTLGVTFGNTPELVINRAFVQWVFRMSGETGIRAVLLHELLHVALADTMRSASPDHPVVNAACDMVINAHVVRWMPESGSFFRSFYRDAPGVLKLLRPPDLHEEHLLQRSSSREAAVHTLWRELYHPRAPVTADEVIALCRESLSLEPRVVLIGSHPFPQVPSHLRRELGIDDIVAHISRQPGAGGGGCLVDQGPGRAVRAWECTVERVLRRFLRRGRGTTPLAGEAVSVLPVLNTSDRRAFARAQWMPIVPDVRWLYQQPRRVGGASVYFDVSGSMCSEIPSLVAVLLRLRDYLTLPFNAFSTEVFPARFRNGRLLTDTTCGTDITCVLEHLAVHRPEKAIIITDGMVGEFPADLLKRVRRTQLHGIITAHGQTEDFDRARVPYTQLDAYPGRRLQRRLP